MLRAILLGAGAQSALILSGLVVYVVRVPKAVIGALSGFGAGALISAMVVACGLASGLGFAPTDIWGLDGDRAAALAAGGLLAMLTGSLMPFAMERGAHGQASGRSSGSPPR
jgi:hypothetical protein